MCRVYRSCYLFTGKYPQLLSILLFCLCSSTFAQSDHIVSQASLAEKIYLQVDADVYSTDQTIWFKAVVLEAVNHQPSGLSGVIYVDLISPDEQLVTQRRIRLNHGIGEGCITLSDRMTRGRYLLRAYSTWNRNFGEDFIFQKYIDIFPLGKDQMDDPILGITIAEKEQGKYRLQARIFPRIIDQTHDKQLSVYLITDDKRDSVLLSENRQGFYELDYPMPSQASMTTVRIETHSGRRYSKTITLPQAAVDLQFFPEGGEWLTDIPTKIAFKALDRSGEEVPVSGRIVDQEGNTLGSFRSNHLGMGSVELLAKAGQTYHAVLDSIPGTSIHDVYPLPQPRSEGYALYIRQQGNNIAILAHDRTEVTDSLYVRISNRGVFRYIVKALPKNGQLQAILPKDALPDGIVQFTLLNHQYRPVAERLYFNQLPKARLSIQASMDKDQYEQREKTDIKIQVLNGNGQPVRASLSLMAVHRDHIGDNRILRGNILTHLLLQSELRGEIAQPNYYFRQDTIDRSEELDDLMLSQGWRCYKYDAPPDTVLPYTNETGLILSGEVIGGVVQRKKREGATISLLTFGENSDMQIQKTDSVGRFSFPLELYVDSVDVLLQSADGSGKNRNYSIKLDSRSTPGITFDQKQLTVNPDSTVSYLLRKREERVRMEQEYLGAIRIEEVVVEARVRTKQEQKVFERFGEADAVISGKAIREKERDWSYGLYSVLMANFQDIVQIKRVRDSVNYLRAYIGGDTTLVVVDGITVLAHCYDLIQYIPPAEVKKVEIIKFADNFGDLYREIRPMSSHKEIPQIGHVVAIYTHAGKGIFNALRTPTGIAQTKVPVYSPTVEFYTPRYSSPEEKSTDRPDLRTLLHWAPQLVTDQEGRVVLSYYNADTPGEITIIIEAVTPEGEIGYQELLYTLKD